MGTRAKVRMRMTGLVLFLSLVIKAAGYESPTPQYERAMFEIIHNNTALQPTSVEVMHGAQQFGDHRLRLRITGIVQNWWPCENWSCRGEVTTLVYENRQRAGSNNTRYGIHHHHKQKALWLYPENAPERDFSSFKLLLEVAVGNIAHEGRRAIYAHVVAQRYGRDPEAVSKEEEEASNGRRGRIPTPGDRKKQQEFPHEGSQLDMAIRVMYNWKAHVIPSDASPRTEVLEF